MEEAIMANQADDEAVNSETGGRRLPEPDDARTPREAHDLVAPEVRKLRHGDDIEQRDTPQPDA
jgi:hypothetical protein